MRDYYIAGQLQIIEEWSLRCSENHWQHMSRTLAGRTLWDMVWLPKSSRPKRLYFSQINIMLLEVWNALAVDRGLTMYLSPLTAIHDNPNFMRAHDVMTMVDYDKLWCTKMYELRCKVHSWLTLCRFMLLMNQLWNITCDIKSRAHADIVPSWTLWLLKLMITQHALYLLGHRDFVDNKIA